MSVLKFKNPVTGEYIPVGQIPAPDISGQLADKVDGNMRLTTSDTAPASPEEGDVWIDTSNPAPIDNLFDIMYPIGHVMINTVDSTNPGDRLNFGVWELIGDGLTLANVNPNYEPLDSPGKTTGTAAHAHPLSAAGQAQIYVANSTNPVRANTVTSSVSWNAIRASSGTALVPSSYNNQNLGAALMGSTDESSNYQPTKAAYIWERVS